MPPSENTHWLSDAQRLAVGVVLLDGLRRGALLLGDIIRPRPLVALGFPVVCVLKKMQV